MSSSWKVFHSLHCGHLPSHLGADAPQLEQKKMVRGFAMGMGGSGFLMQNCTAKIKLLVLNCNKKLAAFFTRRAWCFYPIHNGEGAFSEQPDGVALGENTKRSGNQKLCK